MDKDKILSPITKEIEEKAEQIKADLKHVETKENLKNKNMTNYKELVKQQTSISGYIEDVERFET